MNFSKRESNLIYMLLDDNVEVHELCNDLNVTNKTLKSDIARINNAINNFASEIKVIDNMVTLDTIYPASHWRSVMVLNQDISDEHLIFLKLLFKDDYVMISDFASELYISKSKLEKTFQSSKLIKEYTKRVRNRGVIIDIPVANKFSLAISVLLPYVDDLNYMVSSRRLIGQITDEPIQISEFKLVSENFNQLIGNYEILTDQESKVIFLILMLSKFVLPLSSNEQEELVSELVSMESKEQKLYGEIEKIIINTLSENNIQDIDKQILNNMIMHVQSSVDKQSYSTLSEKLENQIRTEYSYALTIAKELKCKLQSKLSLCLVEEEASYLAIYTQTFLNQTSKKLNLKVLILCQYGLSLSNYIYFWIKQNISEDLDIETSSVLQFWQKKIDIDSYDAIITTIDNIETNPNATIMISSLPTDEEKQLIKHRLSKLSIEKQFKNIVSKENVKNVNIEKLDDLYEYIQKDLGNYNRQYLHKMRERTNEGLTNINGVLIFHSDSSLVDQNRLLIYKINNPITVDDKQVKMVFTFVFTTEFINEYNDVIKKIYKVLYLDDYVAALYETKTNAQFMWIFKNQIQGRENVNK